MRTAHRRNSSSLSSSSSASRKSRITRSVFEALERRELFSISYLGDPTLYSTGATPTEIEVGDLNADGRPDVVAGNKTDESLTVLLNNGAGALVAQPTLALGFAPRVIRIVDLNADGKADLVANSDSDSKMRVFVGNGDGTFASTPIDINLDGSRLDLQFGDVTGDGRPEMFAPASGGKGIAVWHNAGVGAQISFDNKKIYDGSIDAYPNGLALADLNGDGKLDVVGATHGSETFNVLLNNGDGTFGASTDYHTDLGIQINEVVLRDANGDRKLDAIGKGYAGSYNVMLGNGNGTFQSPHYVGALGGEGLAVADFNGDGKADLASGNELYGSIAINEGNGDGTFKDDIKEYLFGHRVSDIAAADFNGDGKIDFAVVDYKNNQVGVVLNTSSQVGNPNPNPNPNPGGSGNPTPAPGATDVDLAPSVVSALPASVVGGAKGKITVLVRNHGGQKLNGPVTIDLFASSDGTIGQDDTAIVSLTKSLKIKAGKSKKVKMKFSFPTGMADGAYQILARVASATEGNTGDNVISASAPVTIARPFVDLASNFAKTPTSLKAGKKAKASVALQNLGNVVHNGAVQVTLYASTDGTLNGATQLATVTKNLKVKTGKSKKVKVSFTCASNMPAGSYYLVATTNPIGVTDTVAANNTATSGAVPATA